MTTLSEIIAYLEARSEHLRLEDADLDNRYDTMPKWAWDMKDAMFTERQRISGFVLLLRTLQAGL